MTFRTVRYLFGEGFRSVRRHPALTLSAVVAMSASLLVLGVFLIIHANVRRILGDLEGRKEIVVYLAGGIDHEGRLRVEERLRDVPGVASVRYVSPEQAWDEFTAEMKGEGLLEEVGENPLPPSFELNLAPDHRTLPAIEAIAGEVGAWEEVDEVAYGGSWVTRLDQFSNQLVWLNLGVLLAVALAVVAVVANTIRLTVLAKRDMIDIMKVVGASEWFIRWPFLFEGMLQALVASLVSLGVLAGLRLALSDRLGGLHFMSWVEAAGFVALSAVLGFIGSYLAVRSILKEFRV